MAGSLNKVLLIGRLGADPQLKYLPSGQPVVNVNLATDESFKDKSSGEKQERTEWHRLTIYGRAAEVVNNYARKGSLLYVEGSLRTRKWQDQQGQDRYTTEIVVRDFTFLDSKRDAEGGYAPQQGYGQGARSGPSGQSGQSGRPGRPNDQRNPYEDDDMGPAFPSEAGGMDDVPF